MDDQRIDAVLRLAAMGVKIIPLFGIKGSSCLCRKGADCGSPGKHPILRDWQGTATDDEDQIIDWAERYPGLNFGILLGPASGIIDIEFDCDEGRATAERVFAGVQTLAYTSGRSVHRLFKFDARLPDVQKLTPKAGPLAGLEIRIGGGGMSTQSVAPPSMHHSGKPYAWLPTMSPDELDGPETLSREFFGMIDNIAEDFKEAAAQKGSGRGREALAPKVAEGGRNETLFRFACRQASKCHRIDDHEDQVELHEIVASVNITKCEPPLSDAEVRTIVKQSIAYEQRSRSATVEASHDDGRKILGMGRHGLAFDRETESWDPGDWQLQRVLSDPPRMRLIVPAWKGITGNDIGSIDFSMEQFFDAGKVALGVASATAGRIVLNDFPGRWPAIWNGTKGTKERKATRSLAAKLVDIAEEVIPSALERKYVQLGDYFLRELSNAREASRDSDEKETLPDDGTPTRLADGTIWFRWQQVWEEAKFSKVATEEEIFSFRTRAGITKHNEARYPNRPKDGQSRRLFIRLWPEDVHRIRKLVEFDDDSEWEG